MVLFAKNIEFYKRGVIMGLKQSIVVVNEYTTKTKKGGSRGGTPGDYVVRYMLRDKATEDLTPVKLEDTDSYITRYMARESACERLNSIKDIKNGMRMAQGLGGIAFGYGEPSLSHAKVKNASKDIQRNFDKGKTVMKTVISFDEEYLRKTGIINPDFYLEKAGDYRGNIDQMKLRMAIMNGLNKMSRSYDDLQYIGVLQVDTKHLHCHLAMVDRGEGNVMPDGTQRGKLSSRNIRDLRRGIDMYLDEEKQIQHMSSNITHDKRNAVCFIKRYAHRTMDSQGIPQFLLSCLPDDKRLWRASTNRKEMQKPNAIVRSYVKEVLSLPDSGYTEAMRGIFHYAEFRKNNDDLSGAEYRQLIDDGKERIIEDCMNGVYSVLKQIPDNQKTVRTPMLDVMSMEYKDMANESVNDPMIEFGFKLRSYSSRLDYHKKERKKYYNAVKTYENAENVSEDSKVLYDFFKIEEEYNAKVMCKYQHFLSFLPSKDEYEDDFKNLMDYRNRMRNLDKLRNDKSAKRMKPENAEDYGRRVYDMHGGRFVSIAPQVLDARYDKMEQRYSIMLSDFKVKLEESGLTFDGKGVLNKKPYTFDEVKALDLHHLEYDFPYDANVSKSNVNIFIEMAVKRYDAFMKAKDYLIRSNQPASIEKFAEKDIMLMKEVADKMSLNPVITTKKQTPDGKKHNGRTIPLGKDYSKSMELAVKAAVHSVQLN